VINSRRSSFKQPCYRKWRASADRLYGDQPDVWAALGVTQETVTGTFKKNNLNVSTAALAAHHATLSGSMSNFPRENLLQANIVFIREKYIQRPASGETSAL
jgi:hypothetical protein